MITQCKILAHITLIIQGAFSHINFLINALNFPMKMKILQK